MASTLQDDPLWAWLSSLSGAAEAPLALVDLARALVLVAGAERVLLALLDEHGHLREAWGADVEGFAVAEAASRIAPETIDRALRNEGALYERDLETPAGRGSRLAIKKSALGLTALVVAEHRFRPSAFDGVTAAQVERWAALAALGLRVFFAPGAADRGSVSGARARDDRAASSVPSGDPPASIVTTVVPLTEPRRAFPGILGQSLALRRALARLDAAIDSDLPVLILGETGTGKELFARALHELGPRRRRAIVAFNCGSVPDALFEAELFGHARGSFTGAERARPGLLAQAEGGTLLLDELGELPLAKQATLLRALESRRYRAVGSDEERPFDVRVVAATNKDLERASQERTFRQDLLYRLNVLTLPVPPLRAREGDVPLLLRAFGERAKVPPEWSERAMEALVAYAWPGNVRELCHVVERLSALGVRRVELEHLPRSIRSAVAPRGPAPRGRGGSDEEQREQIRSSLRATGGNISHAAERLGLSRQGLKKRMARLGMDTVKRAV